MQNQTLATIVWWSGNALLVAILLRASAKKFLGRYPVFHGYLAFVLVDSLLKYYVFVAHQSTYAQVFWYSEFLGVLFGFGIIGEVNGKVAIQSPGVARLTRRLVLAALILIFSKGVADACFIRGNDWSSTELIRDLRTAQAILLLLIIALIAYYAIPVGRHIRGILVGYGLFVAVSVISLALRADLGPSLQPWIRHLQPLCYVVALLIWCAALWSDYPAPVSGTDNADYRRLSAHTLRALSRARHHLLRTMGA